MDGQGENPDENSPHAVQDHSCRGTHPLGDGKPGEVEESNAHNESDISQEQLPVVTHLYEAIDGILEPDVILPEVGTGGEVPRDEVHGKEEDEEESEAEYPLPAHALERRNLVLLDNLLLHRHLNGSNPLSEDDQEVSGKDHLLRHVPRALLEEDVVSDSHD